MEGLEVWTGSPASISCQCYSRHFCAALQHSSSAGSWPCHSCATAGGLTPLVASSPWEPAKSKEHELFRPFLVLWFWVFFYNPSLLMERKGCRCVHVQVVLGSSAIPMPQCISVACGDRSPFVPSPAQAPWKAELPLVWAVAQKQPWPCCWTGLFNLPLLCHHGNGSRGRSASWGGAPTPGKGVRGSGNRAGEGSKSEEQWERGRFTPALGHCPFRVTEAAGLGRSAALLGNRTTATSI